MTKKILKSSKKSRRVTTSTSSSCSNKSLKDILLCNTSLITSKSNTSRLSCITSNFSKINFPLILKHIILLYLAVLMVIKKLYGPNQLMNYLNDVINLLLTILTTYVYKTTGSLKKVISSESILLLLYGQYIINKSSILNPGGFGIMKRLKHTVKGDN